jgi:hypothetical protein
VSGELAMPGCSPQCCPDALPSCQHSTEDASISVEFLRRTETDRAVLPRENQAPSLEAISKGALLRTALLYRADTFQTTSAGFVCIIDTLLVDSCATLHIRINARLPTAPRYELVHCMADQHSLPFSRIQFQGFNVTWGPDFLRSIVRYGMH